MSDIKTIAPPLFLREEELRRGIELLYFAYRDFTQDPDEILREYGFGRAHHRVIHVVGRNPGVPVAGLLKLLRITKQSLSRVLSQLIDEGYVRQEQGQRDRRQRLLYLTDKGEALERALFLPLRNRMARAYRAAGAEAVAGFWEVLLHIVNDEEREAVLRQVGPSG